MTPMWVLYGTGTIARAITQHALQQGHLLTLSGRQYPTVAAMANEFHLPYQVVGLDNPTAIRRLLDQATGIINTAGPFTHTSPPLLRAALDTGTHYLDLSNEWESHRIAHSLHNHATQAGIALVPGAGFGTHAAEALAHHLTQHTPNPANLNVILGTRQGPQTHATRASTRQILKTQPRMQRNGQLTPVSDLHEIHSRNITGAGPRTLVPIADGNLFALTHTLTIPNIAMYATLTTPAPLTRVIIPLARRLTTTKVHNNTLTPTNRIPHQPTKLYAEITDTTGHRYTTTLLTEDGTTYTTTITTNILATTLTPGTHTPHQLLPNKLPPQTQLLH